MPLMIMNEKIRKIYINKQYYYYEPIDVEIIKEFSDSEEYK